MLRGRHQYKSASSSSCRDNYAQSNIASGALISFSRPSLLHESARVSGTGFSFADFLLGYADISTNNIRNHFFAVRLWWTLHSGQPIYRALFCRFLARNQQTDTEPGLALRSARALVGRFNRLSYSTRGHELLTQFLPRARSPEGDAFLVNSGDRNNIPLEKIDFSPRVGLAYGLAQRQ